MRTAWSVRAVGGIDEGSSSRSPRSRSGRKNPNCQLISDYAYWFHNWPWRDESERIDRDDDGQDIGSEFRPPPGMLSFIKAILFCGVGGGILGATIGAALKTINGAGPAAMIGGIPLGMIGAFILGRYGISPGP